MIMLSNERVMQFFGALLIVFMGWMMTTLTNRVMDHQDQISAVSERVSALEIKVKRCEVRK